MATALPLRVFVSVPPQATFVQRVGGDQVRVQVMVQPGHSPATYEPTPRQIVGLAQADLYLRIGVPFEDAWMQRIRAVNPAMRVLDARQGLDLRRLERHEHEAGHEHTGEAGLDPHVWTSPPLVRQMLRTIRDALTDLAPAQQALFDANYRAYDAELDALDREIRDLFRDLSQRGFMVFHPAWGYFADTYGLTQVPIQHQGKEPGARSLTRLVEQARRERVQVIFVQPQFDRRLADQLARRIGARVEILDPLAADYIPNLRRTARLIAGLKPSER